MLSGSDDEDRISRLKQKCLQVSSIANKLAPMMDMGTMCASFSQAWWKSVKNMEQAQVEELEFEVDSDTGDVSIVTTTPSSAKDTNRVSTTKAVDMDMLTDLDIYQYTHNTEYFCESTNDFMVRLI